MGSNHFRYSQLYAAGAAAPSSLGVAQRRTYDFAVAYPDPASLPLDDLLDSARQALDEEGRDLAIYHHPQGYPPLREFVANKLARDRGMQVGADDIILGDGSGQPIHLIAETFVDPGDVVLTEDFVYAGTLNTLRRFGADIRGIACDNEGMLPDILEETIRGVLDEGKRPKFIYTVPTFQNPQGWTMTLARRQAMVGLSQQYDLPILEDDCYVDLRFEGHDVPSLHTLDGTGRVLYVASFSKIIAPGLRLGYLTAPREVLERALGAKSGGSVNTLVAMTVHRYATNQLHGHIEVINDVQRTKRDAMLAALEANMGDDARWSRPQGGLYIWLTLPPTSDVVSTREAIMASADVGYLPGVNFAADGVSGRNRLRLCYGYNTPDEIGEGIKRLAAAFRTHGVLD